jgi:hypothetical protein
MFQKGQSRHPNAGRKVGTKNRRTQEIEEFARSIIEHPDVQLKLLDDALAGTLPPAVMQMLFYYAYGKPVERIEHSGNAQKPLQVILHRAH